MSAIALHDLQDLEPVRARRRQRDHLRLVQPGERMDEGFHVGARTDAPGAGGFTLTRRGRLAITMTVATALVLAVIAAFGMFPATAASGHTITVQPGQTLSQIAVTELPELPMDRAIVQIQVANDMNTRQVQAGMDLEIPGS
ncbi:hypothetical protein FNH13_06705 [Ornithinimicrobium ciconiae]|uniref:LysM domain-containing protein n=1 Tax=Ornithinimicrobium ciconiae TaxID=2594265 RepID=A0A516G972_9MICO|nr:hypothetical protein [Ornithinimicrobium ciconiae]QDO88074.1 hypothetical protein FNH13_06705 [Ornithinimicrobium ciconiae]